MATKARVNDGETTVNATSKRRQLMMAAAALLAAGLGAIPFVAARGLNAAGLSKSDLALIGGVIELVESSYVHPVGSGELTKDALKGMLSRLDPHSDYMDEQEFKQSQGTLSGKFGGLGMEISQKGELPTVISPIDGTPAAEAGMQPGDLIVSIDGQSTQGVDLTKVVDLLRGEPGSTVTLTIARGEQTPFDITLTRRIIQVQTVKSKLQPDGIGYVRIVQFGGETTKDLKQALADLERQAGGRIKGLVLDLRNDPGGLLSAAVGVAGEFLDGGTVVSIHGRAASEQQTFNAPTRGDALHGAPIAVLINAASASASEIVAGALQDRHRATVMGTQSFGKGSVQSIIPLNGHGALRLTTALYYTPSGRSIQDQGISPDVVVEAPKDQQVAGAIILQERALRGAFPNPGPFGNTQQKATPPRTAPYSPPIKTELIGSPDDTQLKAALSHINRAGAASNGPG